MGKIYNKPLYDQKCLQVPWVLTDDNYNFFLYSSSIEKSNSYVQKQNRKKN